MEEKEVIEKVPMGAKPYYICTTDRINELLSAIGRYVNNVNLTGDAANSVRLWAVELTQQIQLLSTLAIYDKK